MADDAGALLVRSGLISSSSLDEACSRVEALGGTIGEQLVFAGAIDDDALTNFFASTLLVPRVNPNSLARLPIRVIATIPNDMAIGLRAIPVSLDADNNLTVAMSDPSDSEAIDEIRDFTGASIVRACATQMQIAWCLAHYYGHVTPLGQKLLQPSASEAPVVAPATPQPTPRAKGVTAQVNALRHRRIAPIPRDAIPASVGADGIGGDTEPFTNYKAPEMGDDTDPAVMAIAPAATESSDGVPHQPRARSISGEIKVPKRAPSIKPPLPIDDTDSGPVITIEHPPEEDRTAPGKVLPKKRRVVQPDPPELAARGGEIDVNTGKLRRLEVDDGPKILIDSGAIVAGNQVPEKAGELEARTTGERPAPPEVTIEIDETLDRESRPILLERARELRGPGDSVTFRQRAPSTADFPDDDDEVVVLQPKKPGGRRDRHTQVGVGIVPAATRVARDTEATPQPIDDAPTTQIAAGPRHDEDDDEDGLEISTAVMSAGELDAAIPERSAEVIPGHLQHKPAPELDDGWGPPGTTIPPPLLGAVPGSDDDSIPGRIPVGDMDSAPLIVAPLAPAKPLRASPSSNPVVDAVRSMEDATTSLLALIRSLEHAKSRDEVMSLMIDHVAATHRRAGFFAIKATELSVFSIKPAPTNAPIATLRLDRPSTLQDVVGTRLPYRGPMRDDDSRTFLASVLGSSPSELLLVPIAVRERVVGLLFGDQRKQQTFDDQLPLAARAAGQALERILKAKRS
ncbi:MAG: hypothetical protein SFX73_02585 [Kofleriaceae bacterium]|nr:hypothetical protein [Kofleriaceae bacterium]